jgi:hypothetical protein
MGVVAGESIFQLPVFGVNHESNLFPAVGQPACLDRLCDRDAGGACRDHRRVSANVETGGDSRAGLDRNWRTGTAFSNSETDPDCRAAASIRYGGTLTDASAATDIHRNSATECVSTAAANVPLERRYDYA